MELRREIGGDVIETDSDAVFEEPETSQHDLSFPRLAKIVIELIGVSTLCFRCFLSFADAPVL